MKIKNILSAIIGVVFTSICAMADEEMDDSWSVLSEVALTISNNSSDVSTLMKIGENDKNILNENSPFNKKARKLFNRTNTYIEFLEYDAPVEEIPFSVFKTVMYGYGWMSYIDWKDLSDPKEMIWRLNNRLKKIKKEELTKEEISEIEAKIYPLLSDPISRIKQMKAANVMIETIDNIVQKRNVKILWYAEVSDSYIYFLVSPSVYEKLNNRRLSEDVTFKTPKF